MSLSEVKARQTEKSRAGEWYAAGLFLVYAALIFVHRGAPSLTDYANWTYQGVLLRDHLMGRPDAAHVLKHYPVPNSAATLGIGLLALVLPWMMAAKVYLCGQMAICWLSVRYLAKTVSAGAVVWVVVPQAVFLNVNFWYGFMNFELGICWVFLMASLLLRRVRGVAWQKWPIGLLLVVAYFTHMIPFCLCGLLVVLYAMQTARWRVLWQIAPAAVLSVWYLVARFLLMGNADGQAGMEASVRDYSAAFWAFKVNSYFKSFGFVNPLGLDGMVFGQGFMIGLLGVTLMLGAVAGWAIVRSGRMGLGRGSDARFLWLGLVSLVPVFVFAPGTALGVSDPGARVLQAGLALALALSWGIEGVWIKRVSVSCASVLSLAGLWLFLCYGGDLGQPLVAGSAAGSSLARFAKVPSDDQDYFYAALRHGDMALRVFPTGMFLNK